MKKTTSFILSIFLYLFSIGQSTNWGVQFCDAIRTRHTPTINNMTNKGFEYSNGIITHGMEKIHKNTLTASYLTYIKDYIDLYVNSAGVVTGLGSSFDQLQPGVSLLYLYETTGQNKYKIGARQIRNYLLGAGSPFAKTPDGGYWHKNNGNYNGVMLVDGIYMMHPFLTKYGKMFNDPECYDVATFQALFMAEKVFNYTTNLPKHAWDYYKAKSYVNPATGISRETWSRGLGWYAMALVDILEYLPATHAKYNDLKTLFGRVADGIVSSQDPVSKLWYTVVDKIDSANNYIETSGSGMMIYALQKGVNLGLINTSYATTAASAWTAYKTTIGTYTDGRPQITSFTPATGVLNNYTAYAALRPVNVPTASGTQHPHGYAAMLMAASVMEYAANPYAANSIAGKVFIDENGLTDNFVFGIQPGSLSTQLFAILVNSSGNIAASTSVGANGNYVFAGVSPGTVMSPNIYTVRLSNVAGTIGAAAPAPSHPTGYFFTGEKNGTAGSDGTANGISGNVNLIASPAEALQVNFGIDALPVAQTITTTVGTVNTGIPIILNGSGQTLTATDTEDGPIGTGGKFKITALPANGKVFYNGIEVLAADVASGSGTAIIQNYSAALLSVIYSNNSSTQLIFSYAATDLAGLSGLAKTYTITATSVSVPAPLSFSAVGLTSMTINFASGAGTNRLVLVKAASAVDASPVNGTSYTASTTFAGGGASQIGTGNWVVYNGPGNTVSMTGLSSGTTYHVSVVEYNISGGVPNYLNPSTVTGSQITLLPTGAYRTKTSGNWNVATIWETFDGLAWVNANASPTSANGTITITAGHTVTVTAAVSVDEVTVEAISGGAQGKIIINASQTLTIANGTGVDLLIKGYLTNSGTITNNGQITVGDGTITSPSPTYEHAQNAGALPTATWGTGSTCYITGQNSAILPTNKGQTFYNFTWDCPNQLAGKLNFNTNPQTNVAAGGTFWVKNTGLSGQLQFCGSGTNQNVFNLDGSYKQSGGLASIWSVSGGDRSMTVNQNIDITAGTLIITEGAGTGSGTLFSKGTVAISGTGKVSQSTTAARITFNGTTQQSISGLNGTGIAGAIDMTVNNTNGIVLGSNLDAKTITINGKMDMTGNENLIISAGGSFVNNGTFTTTGSTGMVNFLGNGSISGSTSFANLSVNGTVTMNNNVTINNSLSLQDGSILDLGNTNNQLVLNGDISGPGTIKGSNATRVKLGGSGAFTGTLNFTPGSQLLSGFEIDRTAADAALGSDLTVTGTNSFILTNGVLATNNFLLSVNNNSFTGGSNQSFIATCTASGTVINAGGLRITGVGSSSNILFPVGSSLTAYNPATLKNSGVTDDFIVKVKEGNLSNTPNPSVKRIWDITEGTTGGSIVGLSFGFNAAETEPGMSNPVYIVHANSQNIISERGDDNILTMPLLGMQSVTSGTKTFTSFSPFSISSGTIILPISDLTRFEAFKSGNNGIINWNVVPSNNFAQYEVEKSTDGRIFKTLSVVKNINSQVHYNITDPSLFAGTNYYRLKVTAIDGSVYYSKVAAIVNRNNGIEIIEILPTLVKDGTIQLTISAATAGRIQLLIYDNNGKQIKQLSKNVAAGNNDIRINLQYLAPGVYYLSGRTKDGVSKTLRFMRQ